MPHTVDSMHLGLCRPMPIPFLRPTYGTTTQPQPQLLRGGGQHGLPLCHLPIREMSNDCGDKNYPYPDSLCMVDG